TKVEQTLNELALEVYQQFEAKWNTTTMDLAVKALVERILKLPKVREEILREWAKTKLEDTIRTVRSASRPFGEDIPTWKPKRFDTESTNERNKRTYQRMLLDVIITHNEGRTRLGDCTKEQVLQAASSYEALAKGNLRESRYCQGIAAKLRAGQKVQEVWNQDSLTRLYRRLRNEESAAG